MQVQRSEKNSIYARDLHFLTLILTFGKPPRLWVYPLGGGYLLMYHTLNFFSYLVYHLVLCHRIGTFTT